jgi:glycosyltransferase involved in cell wall biosynthesis
LGVFLSRLLPEMVGSGHEVVHYYLHGSTFPLYPVEYRGVKCIRLRDPPVDVFERRGNVAVGGVLNLASIALVSHLYPVIPLFDAVVAHDAHSSLVVLASETLGVKTAYYVHMWTHSPLDILAVVHARRVLCNSRLTASQILGAVKAEGKVKVVYPASPYDPVSESARHSRERPLVVIPSRLQDNKSPGLVLKALEEARRRVEFDVVVFGRGAEGYQLPGWIVNKGTVSEEEKLRLYRSADLVLQVGFPEPFGLVALEAISQGAPVLVSHQSGASEVLPPEATYTLEDLADKLTQYLSSRELREELWHRERDSWIMKRTWRDVWREIEEEIAR